MKIILKELYLSNVTHLQLTSRPSCGREIATAADDATDAKHWFQAIQLWTVMQQ